MAPVPDFPIALRLEGRDALVVGGDELALGRVRHLLDAGARVHLVAPVVEPALRALAEAGQLRWSARRFATGDLSGVLLVFAAADPATNLEVATKARRAGALLNTADHPELCDFFMPSIGRRGALTVAVSSAGQAPALSRHARARALEAIGPEYERLLRLLARLRKVVPSGPGRAKAFRALLDGGLGELVGRRDRAGQRRLLREVCGPLLRGVAGAPEIASSPVRPSTPRASSGEPSGSRARGGA
jgi:precorrin-2 dehydrogenase/sirohydrochlorin ferrochelatase